MTPSASELPAPRLSEVERFGLTFLTDEGLRASCGTGIAFTQRTGGVSEGPYRSLNLGSRVDDDPACVAENRERLCKALAHSCGLSPLVVPHQVHGDTVIAVGGAHGVPDGRLEEGCDAVVCLDAALPVCLCFADCTPVVLVAPGGAFAIAHAGWRGALAGIAGKTAHALADAADAPIGGINAYIGPHIGACCYEVPSERIGRFTARYGAACNAGNRHLSLSAAVAVDLAAAGISPERIVDAVAMGECTACNAERYFSYRASGGTTGRMGAAACRLASAAPAAG